MVYCGTVPQDSIGMFYTVIDRHLYLGGKRSMAIPLYGKAMVAIREDGIIIKDADDAFGLFVMNTGSTIIMKRENRVDTFFDVSPGIAGEILQKFSKYHKRTAIVGDFTDIKSTSLKDFMCESNKTGQILYVTTLEEALKICTE
jgi:hypothetical protein